MPSTHQFGIRAFMLPFIQHGRKSLEIRVADAKRKKVRKSDFITFNQQTTKRVVAIRKYPSFVEMLKMEDPEKIMPGWTSSQILTGLTEIYTLDQEELGVFVFQLQVDP